MAITNTGAILAASCVIGTADASPVTPLNAANAYIGLGDSSTAFAAAQTDLQAASNKVRVAMDATYPTRSSNVLTFRSTFSTAQANFAINEFAVFNASSSGTMFSRKVDASLGTKTSSQTWIVSVTLTVQAA